MLCLSEPKAEASLEALRPRIDSIAQRFNRLQGRLSALEAERSAISERVGMAKARMALRDDVSAVLEALRDRVHQRAVGMYEQLLTTFMREVLPEQSADRSLVVSLETKRGQSALGFHVERADGGLESVYDGNGGALTNIVSAALRLVALRKAQRSLRQFLVLDEPDCWIAPDRVPAFYRVLSEASRSLGVQMVAITHHDPSIMEQFDAHFVRLLPNPDKGVSIDADVVRWPQGALGIRSVRLRNYRSHADSFIALSPDVTVLLGANNLGKSAIVDALRAVCYGEAGDDIIRHGADEAEVEIDLGTTRLQWVRRRKGNPKEVYRLLSQSGAVLKEEQRSRGAVPEWVQSLDGMGVSLLAGIDIQIAHQKRPVFLLDAPASTQAAILSVGQESAWVDRLFGGHKSMLATDASLVRQGEARVTQIQRQQAAIAQSMEGVDAIGGLKGLQDAYVGILDARAALDAQRTMRLAIHGMRNRLRLPELPAQPDRPELVDLRPMREVAGQMVDLIRRGRIGASLKDVHMPTAPVYAQYDHRDGIALRRAARVSAIPPIPACPSGEVLGSAHAELSALQFAARKIAAGARSVQAYARIQDLDMPELKVLDNQNMKESLSILQTSRSQGRTIAADHRAILAECGAAERDLAQAQEQAGGVCPVCQRSFHAEGESHANH